VVTDLGIESARWFRVWRARVGRATGRRFVVGVERALAPELPRTVLLLTMFGAFVAGGMAVRTPRQRAGSLRWPRRWSAWPRAA